MDIVIPENIHTCIPISPSSYMGKFGKASLHFSHQLFLHPIKVTINHARGCWHGKFIALHLQNVTDIYLKQVEQHMKEIYYLEAKKLLL